MTPVVKERSPCLNPILPPLRKPASLPNPPSHTTISPCSPHATGRWAKKIRGRFVYFGPWADPDAGLTKYLEQKDALHAGRRVREVSVGTTVIGLCNDFLAAKQALVDSGELTQRTWDDYKAAKDLIASHFGKTRLVEDLDPEGFASEEGGNEVGTGHRRQRHSTKPLGNLLVASSRQRGGGGHGSDTRGDATEEDNVEEETPVGGKSSAVG